MKWRRRGAKRRRLINFTFSLVTNEELLYKLGQWFTLKSSNSFCHSFVFIIHTQTDFNHLETFCKSNNRDTETGSDSAGYCSVWSVCSVIPSVRWAADWSTAINYRSVTDAQHNTTQHNTTKHNTTERTAGRTHQFVPAGRTEVCVHLLQTSWRRKHHDSTKNTSLIIYSPTEQPECPEEVQNETVSVSLAQQLSVSTSVFRHHRWGSDFHSRWSIRPDGFHHQLTRVCDGTIVREMNLTPDSSDTEDLGRWTWTFLLKLWAETDFISWTTNTEREKFSSSNLSRVSPLQQINTGSLKKKTHLCSFLWYQSADRLHHTPEQSGSDAAG